jgi:hypothetical protein
VGQVELAELLHFLRSLLLAVAGEISVAVALEGQGEAAMDKMVGLMALRALV